MGQNSTKLGSTPKHDKISELAESSIFDEEEILQLYERYKAISNSIQFDGVIDQEEFRKSLGYTDSVFANRIFAVFDDNGDGVINFDEFVKGLSVFCSDDMDEKVEFSFKIYDFDGDGYVDKNELYEMLQSILHNNYLLELTPQQVRQLVDSTFAETDADGDGRIDFEEYQQLVRKYPNIVKNLTIDRSTLKEERVGPTGLTRRSSLVFGNSKKKEPSPTADTLLSASPEAPKSPSSWIQRSLSMTEKMFAEAASKIHRSTKTKKPDERRGSLTKSEVLDLSSQKSPTRGSASSSSEDAHFRVPKSPNRVSMKSPPFLSVRGHSLELQREDDHIL